MQLKGITLILTPLEFYSPEDEELFFAWLEKIACLKEYRGVGKELHVIVAQRLITFNELRNLIGLFSRYGLENPGQLKTLFATSENQDWFD